MRRSGRLDSSNAESQIIQSGVSRSLYLVGFNTPNITKASIIFLRVQLCTSALLFRNPLTLQRP